MGSCLSRSKFQGEGQTLAGSTSGRPAAPTARPQPAATGGAPPSGGAGTGQTLSGYTTSPRPYNDAEAREARAKAAEARAKAAATAGTRPGSSTGKLSKKLEEQKKNPARREDEAPERVVWD